MTRHITACRCAFCRRCVDERTGELVDPENPNVAVTSADVCSSCRTKRQEAMAKELAEARERWKEQDRREGIPGR